MSYKGFTEEETKFLIKIGQINKPEVVVKKAAAKKEEGELMAIYLANGAVVTLNSVDLSDHVTAVTINRSFDELEVTAMGDSAHKFVKGLEASTITIDFLNDAAAGEVNATLQAAWGTTVPLTIKQDSWRCKLYKPRVSNYSVSQ
jgi:hypothetical protein